MTQAREFRLPDLGEGLTEADIVSWAVEVGDTVALNQVIAEVETAKALVELPSPFAGVVLELLVEAGQTVPVGTPMIRIGEADAGVPENPEGRPQVLVGYGPEAAAPSKRARLKRPVPEDASDRGTRTNATPAARLAARKRETRTPITGLRKQTAAAMVRSAFTAPQVTEFVTVDVTRSMKLLERLRGTAEFAGLTLTPLSLVAKAMIVALRENPTLNSTWDEASQEIVTKHYVNLGIATATARGLLVPNVKDAHQLSLLELCRAIGDLIETARGGRASPPQLTGGTIAITNVGVFGIDAGTPILNPGEAAILCLGAVGKRPWVHEDQLAVRSVTTLSLSFDHRLVDGEQGSRFLAAIAGLLREPATLLAHL